MTSHDVRDMLNLPAEGSGPRPSKKQKTSAARPNLKGLAREVQSLGGDNPIAIVPEIATFKKRRFGSRKPAARWEMRPFVNSGRSDQLELRHWRKQTEEQARMALRPEAEQTLDPDGVAKEQKHPDLEGSTFAKFNVQVDIPQYNDDQYNANLTSDDWTKDETDYLMEMAKLFDLRWPLIWDRYDYLPKPPETIGTEEGAHAVTDPITAVVPVPKNRNLEELKHRYYQVAAKMMAVQKPVQYMTQAEFALHEMMVSFNPASELHRKKFAQDSLNRSKDEAREEEALLIEVRRIVARQDRLNQERRELYSRLDYPRTPKDKDINEFKSSSGLQTLLQTLMNTDRSKKRKSIMDANGNNTPASANPSGHAGSTPISESRRDSIAASVGSHRDSIGGGERPERPTKKGTQPPERKKLTEQEEQIYGVSYHDRLPSGPTFRYERINKILTTKSHAQHQRITNTLAELDIPSRLNMPTRGVVEEMEKLLGAIGALLDLRKLNDKLDGEIKLENAKIAERQRPLAPAPAQAGNGAPVDKAETSFRQSDDTKEGVIKTNGAEDSPIARATESAEKDRKPNGEEQPATSGAATDGQPEDETGGVGDNATVKRESKEDKAGRPGTSSGGRNKRSASVLSSVSDTSAKRQKK